MTSTSAWSSRAIELMPMTPHLNRVGARRPGGGRPSIERPVGVRLEEVRAGEPGPRVHAVDADEDEVDVDGPERGDRERPDERVATASGPRRSG